VKYGYSENSSISIPLLPVETKYDTSEVNEQTDYSPQLQKSIIKSTHDLKSITVQASDLELEEQVGAGSSGQVYRGTFMGSKVAVKRCLIVDLLDDPLKYFMQETNVMSVLRHPNVVKFFGASLRPPYFYIITEFCDNGSVDPLYKKMNLTMKQKVKMMLDTALGMLYLSKNDIIHRDLVRYFLFLIF
jgi:serine/threonine protein kinase